MRQHLIVCPGCRGEAAGGKYACVVLSMLSAAHNAIVHPKQKQDYIESAWFQQISESPNCIFLDTYDACAAWNLGLLCTAGMTRRLLQKHALSAMRRKWAPKAISMLFLNGVACTLREHLACTEGPVCLRSVGMPCC